MLFEGLLFFTKLIQATFRIIISHRLRTVCETQRWLFSVSEIFPHQMHCHSLHPSHGHPSSYLFVSLRVERTRGNLNASSLFFLTTFFPTFCWQFHETKKKEILISKAERTGKTIKTDHALPCLELWWWITWTVPFGVLFRSIVYEPLFSWAVGRPSGKDRYI